MENFVHEWKNDMLANMATLFWRGVLWGSGFLGNLKALDKKLDLQRTPTQIEYFSLFYIFSGIASLVLNNPLLRWPIGALLHRSVKRS